MITADTATALRRDAMGTHMWPSEIRDAITMLEEAIAENEADAEPPINLIERQKVMLEAYRDKLTKHSGHSNVPDAPDEQERARPRGGSGDGTGRGRDDKGMATDKQKTFLAKLLAGRTDDIAVAARARIDSVGGYVNKETASKLIDQLMKRVPGVVAIGDRMTDGQRDFIATLMEEKLNLRGEIAAATAAAAQVETTRNEASAMIETLKAKPLSNRAQEGFYEYNGDVVKVQRGATTNNLFAKVLVVDAELEKGFEWVYTPGLIGKLKGAARLSPERAQELAIDTSLYGYCFMCSRKLTDEESIARMIGRICWDKL